MTQANANTPVVEKWERQRIRHVHRHKPVRNINQIDAEKLTTGQRIADRLAAVMGSWSFIIIQSVILTIWICLNVAAYINHWDPYPFILLNLALSFQAAYAAPIIMMSQNRQAAKDRLMAEQDYDVNIKAEEELKSIMTHLEQQDEVMLDILRRIEGQHQVIRASCKWPGLTATATRHRDKKAPDIIVMPARCDRFGRGRLVAFGLGAIAGRGGLHFALGQLDLERVPVLQDVDRAIELHVLFLFALGVLRAFCAGRVVALVGAWSR
jgi:uncharacterized membrane protein